MKKMAAGKFKAQCLALLDEVAREHETILVTKRGKPVARVVPAADQEETLKEKLKGSILHEEDILSPVPVTWEAAS